MKFVATYADGSTIKHTLDAASVIHVDGGDPALGASGRSVVQFPVMKVVGPGPGHDHVKLTELAIVEEA